MQKIFPGPSSDLKLFHGPFFAMKSYLLTPLKKIYTEFSLENL